MEESVLYRLVLAKTFLSNAQGNAAKSDMTSLAIAVVNIHDAFDNLCGAVATHRGIHISENVSLMKTFDRVAGELPLPGRPQLEQLNSLRNAVKHHGLHPNPDVVRRLVPELVALADDMANRVFGRPLAAVRPLDAIQDENIRGDMRRVESLIESAEYRSALEQLAFVMFSVYELQALGSVQLKRSIAAFFGPGVETPSYEFPDIEITVRRLDFLELGLDPREYELFHAVVPRVGLMSGTGETTYVMKKNQYTWHPSNWSLEHCDRAFDFLLRLIVAQQTRSGRPQIVYRQDVAALKFLCDSAIFKDAEGTEVHVTVRAGDEIAVLGLPYVDEAWQDHGERRVQVQYYVGPYWSAGYINKPDVIVVVGRDPRAREA